jgi:predicted phage baseplate assembly protein
LTQPGVVQLMLPQGALIGAPSNDARADGQAGVGMKPPRIDDPAVAARLLAWVRLNVQSALTVSWAGVNAVQIDQRKTYSSIVIGVSDGSANQQFTLPNAQVDATTFQLDVDMPGLGFQLWQQTDDLAVLQGPVAAYVLDPEAGTVTFGNQLQGMIVPAGRRIRVRTMRAGGGAAGNLPAGSLVRIQAFTTSGIQVQQTITVQQPLATTGGADAETLAAAEQRLPALLQHQNRAVTAADYRNLTEEIPGSGIARVEVLPLFKPQTRTSNVPGVVSVMVIPDKDGVLNPCPRADRPLLQTVYQYLSPRTPVTAEMYVIASEYQALGIAVAVEVKTGYPLLQVSQAVETALRTYLWPIPPGGPDSSGWPLGRHVRSLELEVIVSQVPGVIEVNGLDLFQPLASGSYQQLPTDPSGKSTLTLSSWELPEVLAVTVAAGPDGSGIAVPPIVPPVETDPAVAVPIVPSVC